MSLNYSRRSIISTLTLIFRKVGDTIHALVNKVVFSSRFASHIQVSPLFFVLIVLFIIPLLYLFWISFWHYDPDSFAPTSLTLENYQRFLQDPFFMESVTRTLKLGLLTTLATLAIGYPLALIMLRSSSTLRGIFLMLTLMPLMISVVVRVFGWMIVLGNAGIINRALLGLGIIDTPIRMVHNLSGVVIGLTQVELPFMVMPIFSSLVGIKSSLEEAAATLGANKLQVFLRIILPLSMPGVAAGCALVFSLTVSAFVQPQLLGGSRFFVMTTLLYQNITSILNWPFGAAIGFILLGVSIASLAIFAVGLRRISARVRSDE